MKVDEKDISPGTVVRDLKKIYSSLEPALPGQRPANVRQPDRVYRCYNDVAVTHSIAPSYLYMTTLPNTYRARDFAQANSLAELFREDHVFSFPKKNVVYSLVSPRTPAERH